MDQATMPGLLSASTQTGYPSSPIRPQLCTLTNIFNHSLNTQNLFPIKLVENENRIDRKYPAQTGSPSR